MASLTTETKFTRPRFGISCLLAAVFAFSAPSAWSAERTKLVIYTALEPEQHDPFKQAIEAAVPDVEVVWVWGQTGEITDRFLAERDHPHADMLLGLAATSLLRFEREGLLLSYRPVGSEQLREQFADEKPPYTWTGMDAYLGVICYNGDSDDGRGSAPVFWRDLLSPGLKGRIVMPDPLPTGTGYLLVAGWLQSMGEAEGWAFMDALDKNVAAYLPTGAAPCVETAAGHYTVGMTYDMRAALLKAQGAPIRLIVPIDGVGWEEEAFAVVKGSSHEALAKRVADWAATKAANELYADTFAIVAHPDVSKPPANYPAYAEARMIRNNLEWKPRTVRASLPSGRGAMGRKPFRRAAPFFRWVNPDRGRAQTTNKSRRPDHSRCPWERGEDA